jgi:hypothetical protein
MRLGLRRHILSASMELYDGRRRPKGSREYARRIYVMSSIANDYEDFEMVLNTTAKWAEEDGLQFGREELLSELSELILKGYAQSYVLSAQPPHTLVADYSEARADDLWFMLTPAGIRELNELDAQSGSS